MRLAEPLRLTAAADEEEEEEEAIGKDSSALRGRGWRR